MNQFDWPNRQKNESMEGPQDRRFYFEVLTSSPLAHPYGWKEDNNLPTAHHPSAKSDTPTFRPWEINF
jgi:hypothetical protein